MHAVFGQVSSRLEEKSTCTCLGYNLTYECTISGHAGGLTVWEGSALDCESTQNEIRLLHGRFVSEDQRAYGTCNDGAVEGQSVKVEGDAYTSRLTVNVGSEMIGRSIECVYDDGSITNPVGTATIAPTTGKDVTAYLLAKALATC